ncbi:hypothetical protein GCM10027594_24200 [Hymenobacter agri]
MLLLVLSALPGHGQSRFYLYSEDIALPARINTIALLHIDFDTTLHVGNTVAKGQSIGQTNQLPLVRSVRYGMKIIASEDAYAAGDFATAAHVLEEATRHEPANPFITCQLARSLYRNEATKPRAYELYQRLIRQIEASVPRNDTILYVDAWFAEAYWKLGTLYLDHARWADAVRSISQFLAATSRAEYAATPLYEEILGYLTESFYQLGDAKLCRHYGQLTLKFFPHNQYVLPYLAHLPPKAKVNPKR